MSPFSPAAIQVLRDATKTMVFRFARASEVTLPKVQSADASVLAPAEVEVS